MTTLGKEKMLWGLFAAMWADIFAVAVYVADDVTYGGKALTVALGFTFFAFVMLLFRAMLSASDP